MKNSILNFGKVLNKEAQQLINGGFSSKRCKIEIDCPGGFYFDNYTCSCKEIIF